MYATLNNKTLAGLYIENAVKDWVFWSIERQKKTIYILQLDIIYGC